MWQDRIQEAAYTSPSGVRVVGQYESLTKQVDKHTSAHNFPDAEGTYIQDLGRSGRRVPFRFIFSGADHDTEAATCEEALLERGQGRFEHPVYGTFDVVPFGTINTSTDLVNAANQTTVDVTFWETTGVVYPLAQQDPLAAVLDAVTGTSEAAADEFGLETVIDTAIDRAELRNVLLETISKTVSGLQEIANATTEVAQEFNSIADSVVLNVSRALSAPTTIASQVIRMVQTAALSTSRIKSKLVGFGLLISGVIGAEDAISEIGFGSRGQNTFRTRDLAVVSYVTGAVVSLVGATFTTRLEVLQAADELLAQFDQVNEWREANFESLERIDQGAEYQGLLDTVSLTAGYLVELSFSLKQERSVVLSRARTIVDLEAELYGTVDENLDLLISSNDLSGSEILELPKGRKIVYYV